MRTATLAATLATSLVAALAACGDSDTNPPVIDAPAAIDSSTAIDAAGQAQTCANYCALISANCTAANAMYGGTAECMASCMHVPAGTAADMSGNTLGCRIYHADAAATNAALHCRHAGPGGDGACGMNCEGFCTVALGSCAGQANPPYASMGACLTACAGFATTPPYSAATTSGNSLACRLYHATAASTTPTLHCPHTAAAGGPCQ
jgi:hypothetical protein